MTDAVLDRDDAAQALRTLAAAAAPAIYAQTDLAQQILRRARRRRRSTRAATGLGGVLIATAAVAAAVLRGGGDYFATTQPSGAMSPTIRISEQVVASKTLAPHRNDVVVAHLSRDGLDYDTIKRVVALGGDTVGCPADASGKCAAVVVNGAPAPAAYLGDMATDPFPVTTVPAGTVFLLGDNRPDSLDSREWGPIAARRITGVVVRIVDRAGQARPVPGAPRHTGPGGSDVVDPPGPVPPAQAAPIGK